MARTNLSGKVLPPSRLAHVVLRTPESKPMLEFYKIFLGARVVAGNDSISFLTYDDEHHRIAIMEVPDCGDKNRMTAGLDHISFTFETLDDLLVAYQQRKAHGIVPIWCVNHGPTTSMYYQDPDGNVLETQVDNLSTVEESMEYMASPEFAENPIGIDFDPEDLIKRLESGEPEKELKKRPNIGPRDFGKIPLLNLPIPAREKSGIVKNGA
ncbi:Glyoxalase/Bleomycin resistance protein/Dihydroxybiphenyl dioxygenase [Daldinia caldariorum]|uniref:Glyoxalase/Bleomycin resistance protein/Dihydroxybiphenyl dioxygenase n=1 Tax=Daldinia caldariorum TaxID=326644 RepID=UPI0020087A1E|nr:Glyoxalase/Bleomycin resistance protein/Dihydroxybiphenyl dioxygenase [Daldinia caldariorum]KAI1463138.1 Glyoxalase/Bleomycin resistance protein/Dihydroxybiphenyl dioxygenase [Daldinia caldariorum]